MIGKIPEGILSAILETIPIEISVLDANDKVLGWNKHTTRTFKRPPAVVGRDVRNCHPEKSRHKVEQILKEMKEGKREKARFWIDLTLQNEQKKMLIEYYALRDENGNYLGCLEASQDLLELQSLQGEKRLIV
jgi:PAS domain S-box-containing protein